MIGPLGRLGAAATLGQHCPQMTQRRCTERLFMNKIHQTTYKPLTGAQYILFEDTEYTERNNFDSRADGANANLLYVQSPGLDRYITR